MAVAEVADEVMARLRAHQVQSVEELYERNGVPHESIVNKHTSYLTPLIEEFIRRAPFYLIATADGEGNCDVSPKGDPAGGVKILDARTIVVPDRAGNRRVDGHRNIIENPHRAPFIECLIPSMRGTPCFSRT